MPAPLEAGTLLIAALGLEEPNFNRTVVLLLQHNQDEGTLGLVLNRPLKGQVDISASDELRRLARPEGEAGPTIELGGMFFQGGPCETTWMFFLHRLDTLIPGGTEVCEGVFLGGDLDAVRAESTVLNAKDPVLRFYLGYAGWSKGQLENEIAMGAWILAPAHGELIFDPRPESMWQQSLYSLGGKYRSLSLIPENPDLN